MLTCRKVYTDIPFAHRQHLHEGHCSFIHGHNWTITVTFACRDTDANGFVIDFGKLGFLKSWIAQNLDHACVFNESDPERERLLKSFGHLFKSYVVPNASSEGLAQHLAEVFNQLVQKETTGRVWVVSIEIGEDTKNAATYVRPRSS